MQSVAISFLSCWQRVIDGNGISIAIMGILIVFASLAIVSIMVAAIPHILVFVNKYYPEPVVVQKKAAKKDSITDDIIAAIGTALFHSYQVSESK